jgi:hypothetical protein
MILVAGTLNVIVFWGVTLCSLVKKKGKTVPITHLPDYRFTDGDKMFTLTSRPLFISKESSWYSFLLEAESNPRPYCDWKY